MHKYEVLLLGVLCVSLTCSNLGCQPATDTGKQQSGHGHGHDHDHDHSDRPKNLQTAIAELTEMANAIRTAMEEDDPKSAHEPLHKVGSLLKAMPDLAADTDLPESDWDAIKAEVDRLFDAFGDIDSAFHKKDGDKQAAYDAAKSTVDEGMAALEAYLPKLGPVDTPAKHDDHDHEAHDEEEGHDHEAHDEEEGHDHESHDEESHDEEGHDEEEDHDEEASDEAAE